MAHLRCVRDRNLKPSGGAGSCVQRNRESKRIAVIVDLDAMQRHHTPSKKFTSFEKILDKLFDDVPDFIAGTISAARDEVRHIGDREQAT